MPGAPPDNPPDIVTIHVPFRFLKRGGRKEMLLPDGAEQSRRTDSTLVRALARAFHWKRMLDTGEVSTIAELANREGIASSHMTRILRLTLLAQDIIEAILDGRQAPAMTLPRFLEPFSAGWEVQQTEHRCRPIEHLLVPQSVLSTFSGQVQDNPASS